MIPKFIKVILLDNISLTLELAAKAADLVLNWGSTNALRALTSTKNKLVVLII